MNIRGRICVRLIEHLIINNRKTKVSQIDETSRKKYFAEIEMGIQMEAKVVFMLEI